MTNLEKLVKDGKAKVTHPDPYNYYSRYDITISVDHEHYLRAYQSQRDSDLDAIEWLSKEYVEPIKLTPLEHSLLQNYFDYNDTTFKEVKSLMEMRKHYGYFKSFPTTMRIIDILNNCELLPEETY